jgi:hypothetical protein
LITDRDHTKDGVLKTSILLGYDENYSVRFITVLITLLSDLTNGKPTQPTKTLTVKSPIH